jgi:threonine dehydrogenase-like Zn-dependent dehydrogenase
MRAAVVSEPGRLEIVAAPEPRFGPYQALVQTLAGGLCGTDRHIVDGTFYRRAYPAILGHESVGRVVEVGESVRHLAVGDMVLRTTAVRPGEQLGEFGSMLGAFAEVALATDVTALEEDGRQSQIVAYDRMQRVVPPEFDPVDAGGFIVLKETLSWLRRLTDVSGCRVLVIGTGAAGMSFVRLAKLDGASQVLVLGRRHERIEQALSLGADNGFVVSPETLADTIREATDGHGVDVVIEAAGAPAALEVAPDCLARGGVIGVYGLSVGQMGTFRWGWDRPTPRTWSLRFEEPDEAGVHDEAWQLVRSGRYDLKATLTAVLPFDEAREAVAEMARPTACKVAIEFDAARASS